MKFLCFGAGALGTYIGGSLALAGHSLVFVEQPAVVDQLKEKGLRLDLGKDRRRSAAVATVNPGALALAASLDQAMEQGPYDAALYALKSFDTDAAVESMSRLREGMPPIVCFSNGVDNEPKIAAVLGPDRVIAGTVTSAVGRRGPGDILLERLRGVGIALGHARSQELVSAADAAYLNARGYARADAMKWSKMLTNLIANPTSAILDMTAAEVFADPDLYAIEIGMLRECLSVMRARNIPPVNLPGTPVRALALAVGLPAAISKPLLTRAAGSGRGGKMPSFHIDLRSGRGRSEVEYLHGAVDRNGRELGVPTPINAFLTETLMALASGKIPLDEFSHQPAKLIAAVKAAGSS